MDFKLSSLYFIKNNSLIESRYNSILKKLKILKIFLNNFNPKVPLNRLVLKSFNKIARDILYIKINKI